jgi:hypothetical protein
MMGVPLMRWQREVADVGLELIESPAGLLIPAYREIVITVMRQTGKTTILLALENDRCISWGRTCRVVYTAQTGWEAHKKLINDHAPMIQLSDLGQFVARVLRGAGNEAIEYVNGSRIEVVASTASAGHGATYDMGVIDEAFSDVDDRREQAILPALLTKPDGQLIVASTQGTDESIYLNRKTEMARQATIDDTGHGVAYFEYSANPETDDYADPETWWSCMPALGWTITEEVVAHAFQTMTANEFSRSMMNVRDSSESFRPIPVDLWTAAADGSAAPGDGLVFGVEVNIDRSMSAIVAADSSGRVEVIDHGPGVSWLRPRIEELLVRHSADVVIDPRGPARAVGEDLRRCGINVRELTSPEVAAACQTLSDLLAARSVKVRPHSGLDDAAASAKRRWSGDQWYWRRDPGVDTCPIGAMTWAVFVARAKITPQRDARLLVI